MSIFKALMNLLAPGKCIFCGRRAGNGSYRCGCCEEQGRVLVRRLNVPMGKSSRMLKVYSPHIYTGEYRRCLHAFKFRGKWGYAPMLAEFITDTVKAVQGDIITAVPLTEDGIKKRGYNQSERLAREIGEITGIPYGDVLVKVKDNKPQHSLSAEERKANVKGAFAVKGDIKGQKIILVDDIITTGSTLCECAKVLYRAGAADVTGLCAADVETKPLERR